MDWFNRRFDHGLNKHKFPEHEPEKESGNGSAKVFAWRLWLDNFLDDLAAECRNPKQPPDKE